jgi:hypothetical protein
MASASKGENGRPPCGGAGAAAVCRGDLEMRVAWVLEMRGAWDLETHGTCCSMRP